MRVCLAHTSQYSVYIFWSCMSGIWTLHCTQVQYTIITSHHESLCTLKHLSLQSLPKPPISPSPSPSANVPYLGLNHGRPGCHPDQRWNYSLLCRSWPHQTSSWPSVPGATRRNEHPLLGWDGWSNGGGDVKRRSSISNNTKTPEMIALMYPLKIQT